VLKDFIFKPLSLGSILWVLTILFGLFEKSITKEGKEKLAGALTSFSATNFITLVSEMLSKSFNRIFGSKYFTKRSFVKSTQGSLISVLILYFTALSFNEVSWESLVWKDWFIWSMYMALNFLILNLIPDYLMYFKTRFVIDLIKKGQTGNFRMLLADIIGTFIYGGIKYLIIVLTFGKIFNLEVKGTFSFLLKDVLTLSIINFQQSDIVYLNAVPGAFFYSVFIYSIFIWLYFLSAYLIKRTVRFNAFHDFLNKWLDFKDKPIESIRTLSVGFVALIGCIIYVGDVLL